MTYFEILFEKEKKSILNEMRYMIQFTKSWFCTYACYPQ